MEKEIKIMEEKAMVIIEIAKLNSRQLLELSSTIQLLSNALYRVGKLLIDYASQKKLKGLMRNESITQGPEYNSVERKIEETFGEIITEIIHMSEKDVKRLREKIEQLKERERKKDEGTKGLIRV